MTKRYYAIASLELGRSLIVRPEGLVVSIDRDVKVIENDRQLRENWSPRAHFWLSGGGSFLFNGAYLLVVRRSVDQNNSGMFSLFTGRANGLAEWLEPVLIFRELFEEVLLLQKGAPILPRNLVLQSVIDGVYGSDPAFHEGAAVEIEMDILDLPKKEVSVWYDGKMRAHGRFSFHINSTHDINFLSVLTASIDLASLKAICREDAIVRGRDIFALNVFTRDAVPLSGVAQIVEKLDDERLTEHCRWLVRMIRDSQAEGAEP